jgi:hypothetical protein
LRDSVSGHRVFRASSNNAGLRQVRISHSSACQRGAACQGC